MSKRKSSISQARSFREIAEFWDKHSLSDFWDTTSPAEFEVKFEPEVKYYAIKISLADRLARLAEEREVAEETLLNTWIRDKIEEELETL
jgi:hypothetical protein